MNENQNPKQVQGIAFFIAILFTFLFITEYCVHNRFAGTGEGNVVSNGLFNIYLNLYPKLLLLKFLYIVILAGAYYVATTKSLNKGEDKENELYYHVATVSLIGLFFLGFLKFSLYDIVIYPIVFISMVYFLAKSINTFSKPTNKSSDILGGISQKPENDMSLVFDTDKGKMVVHKPQQGMYVEGGAGAGKSASVIEPAIKQFMEKNFTGIIYDWKGNPEPTLGKTAYSAQLLRDAKKDLKLPEGDRKWSQVAFISFTDLTRSTRCNPIHPDNLTSVLFATEIANIIMTTLKKEWLKKKDFWADNGIAVIGATIWMLKKHRPDYCDIPHMVGLLLTDLEACMNWMATDEEIGMMMQPIVSAYKKEASGQIAGVEASAQLPITKLFTAEISWVLSANDLNLDLNNMDNPTMLCISNDSVLKSALSPIISTIIMVCLNKMNVKGKQRSCLCVDELPTIYIPDLDMIPATARSNKVVTLLAAQLFNQIEDMYGKTLSDVILGNLGTQFFGMSNLQKTGDYVEKMLGEYKKLDTSTSENDQGGSSTSESYKNEKVMVARDVMSQPTGHFTGKVADGDPPFFSVQMAEFKMEKQDIPPFYVPVETGNPKLNKDILMKMAEDNHLKIIRECRELLTPFVKIPEDKNAREEY